MDKTAITIPELYNKYFTKIELLKLQLKGFSIIGDWVQAAEIRKEIRHTRSEGVAVGVPKKFLFAK